MKSDKIFGIIWLSFGFIFIFQGLYNLYEYSAPSVVHIFIIPLKITYAKLIYGFFCLFIATTFFKENSEKAYLILSLTVLIIINSLIDAILYRTMFVYSSGINILLVILAAISLYRPIAKIDNLIQTLKSYKFRIIMLLIIGFTPYLIAELTTYESFLFLH